MKRNYYLSLIICLLSAILTISTMSAQNLVPNSSFENGTGDTFTNWSKFNGADAMVETTVPEEVQNGSRALKAVVAVDGNPFEVQLVSDPIATIIGQEYTFTVFVKAAVAGTKIRFSTNPNPLYSADYEVSEEWSQLTWTFTANDTATRMVLDLGAQANTYFLDSMEMLAPPAEGNNIVPNPSLELGSGNDFQNWSKFNGANTLLETTDSNEIFEGSRALKVVSTTDGNPFEIQFVSDPINVIEGVDYTFSLVAKALIANKSIRVTIKDQDGADLVYGADQVVTEDWSQLSWSFTASTPSVRIALDMGSFANTYFIDAMQIIEPDTVDESNELANGGFEEGGNDDFSNWGKFNGAESLLSTTDAEDVFKGSRALKAAVSQDGQTFEVQLVSDTFVTTPGATYKFKASAKSISSENSTIQLSAKDAENGNTDFAFSQFFLTGTDYNTIEWSFVAASASTRVVFNLGLLANTYFIDEANVQIECGETLFSPPSDQKPIADGKNKFLGTVYDSNDSNIDKYFNQITPENSGKWGAIESSEGVFDWSTIDEARAYAAERDFPFRFHVLVWGNQQPLWLKPLSNEEKVVQLKEWFQAVAGHYDNSSDARKTLEYLEVVNEILNDPPNNEGDNASDAASGDYIEALRLLNGELGTESGTYDWVVNSFKLARQYFPCETKLVLNDYRIESESIKTAEYVEIIKLLKKDNLIDVVAMQAHSFNTRRYGNGSFEDVTSNLENNLNTIAAQGLPIMVSELDIDGDASLDANGVRTNNGTQEEQDAFQLSEYERIFGLYWNHPSVIGITLWGYRTGLWRTEQEAYIMDPCDGSEKPAMANYLNTVIRNGVNPPLDAVFVGQLAEITVAPEVQQYSDNVTINIKIPGGNRSCGAQVQSAQIFIDGQEIGQVELVVAGTDLIGSIDLALLEIENTGLYSPGVKIVSAVFDNEAIEETQTTLEITPEDATVELKGRKKFIADDSGIAKVRVKAFLTELKEEQGGALGDLTNADIRFLLNGEPLVIADKTDDQGYLLKELKVAEKQLISMGLVALNFDLNIGDETEVSYTLLAEVNSYYYGISDAKVITIKKRKPAPSVTVWPNPTTDKFRLTLNNFNTSKRVKIKVYNCWGRKIYSKNVSASEEIAFGRNFRPGIYFLHVKQGRLTTYKQLVKRH